MRTGSCGWRTKENRVRSRFSTASAVVSEPASGRLVNIFHPELVVIGGGFAAAGDFVSTLRARSCTARRCRAGERVPIVRAELGTAAGLIGAGLVAFDALALALVPLAVCATPIGNLDDVTLRLLEELRCADVILCEDTRHTRVLLDRHGISGAKLLSYHEHNEAERTAELLPRLEAGERSLSSPTPGMPGISDPGARLVEAALEHGVPVTVLPGPTAVETALVASGFAADRYQFVGFLPRGAAALASLWRELAGWPIPWSRSSRRSGFPRRSRSLAEALPGREVAVCRELTKKFEEVVRGTAHEVAARFAEPPKGEITLVLGAGPTEERDVSAAASRPLPSWWLPESHAGRLPTRVAVVRRVPQPSSTAVLCSQY